MDYDDPNYSGQGFNAQGGCLRLAAGGVIILIALIGYYGKSQINPVTGEAQHISLSVPQEISLGLQSTPSMMAEMGGEVSPGDPLAQLVTHIGTRVHDNSDARLSQYPFKFHLLNDNQTVNAFALPGGQIFITKALLVRLGNEAQLAGVLGHEIGHVINRHAAVHMEKGKLGEAITRGVYVATSDHGQGAALVTQQMNSLIQLGLSRSDESQADEFGFKYMAQAGYDPREMLGVMEVLKQLSASGRQPELLTTHPYPEHRIERINALLKEHYPNGVPGNLTKGAPIRRAEAVPYR